MSIAIDRGLKDEVTKLPFLDDHALLVGELLSDIFPHPEPLPRTLHIVVANYTRMLFCLIEGDANPFEVTVSTDKSISILKQVIRDIRKNGPLRDVDAPRLVLWKVSRFSRNYLACS